MTKYRIVSREDAHGPMYFAQIRFLRFFWEDCSRELLHMENFKVHFENPSRDIKLVENYIKFLKKVEEITNSLSSKNQKVVKTY